MATGLICSLSVMAAATIPASPSHLRKATRWPASARPVSPGRTEGTASRVGATRSRAATCAGCTAGHHRGPGTRLTAAILRATSGTSSSGSMPAGSGAGGMAGPADPDHVRATRHPARRGAALRYRILQPLVRKAPMAWRLRRRCAQTGDSSLSNGPGPCHCERMVGTFRYVVWRDRSWPFSPKAVRSGTTALDLDDPRSLNEAIAAAAWHDRGDGANMGLVQDERVRAGRHPDHPQLQVE